jgi:hypothetical protein
MVNNGVSIRNYTLNLAGIKSKADKQCKLEELCRDFGLVYKKGGNFSSGHIEPSATTRRFLSRNLKLLIELLNKCHLEINVKSYGSTTLSNEVTDMLKPIFPEFDILKIERLTDNILGLMTHRKDGRWYKFESSLSSPPRHAALLIGFLEKEAGITGHTANLNKKHINLGNIDLAQRNQFLDSLDKFWRILKNSIHSYSKKGSTLLGMYTDIFKNTMKRIEDPEDVVKKHTEDAEDVVKKHIKDVFEIVEQHAKSNNIETLYDNIKSFDVQLLKLVAELDTNFFNDIVKKLTNLHIMSFIYDNENPIGSKTDSYHCEFIYLMESLFIVCLMNSGKLYSSTWDHLNLSIISFEEITKNMTQPYILDKETSNPITYSHSLLWLHFIFLKENYNNRVEIAKKALDELDEERVNKPFAIDCTPPLIFKKGDSKKVLSKV